MKKNMVTKIIASHLVTGNIAVGEEIGIKIDQTLTQDSTGTMAYLQLEAMNIPCVKTKLSVAYVDHNTLQTGYENADDHAFIQTIAAKHGIVFSKPGNGICHQVHLERFGRPGMTLLGSDSHTPTGGGIGMLAIGAGGLDVAVAMAGGAYYLKMPQVCQVELTGKLSPWVSAKDVILELLKRLTVKGGTGRVFEYTGEGVASLTVPERATITNMGAELGATTSLFPSDNMTKAFLVAQGRGDEWIELTADKGARYDETIIINLDELEPLVAMPHSPDNVTSVAAIAGIEIDQVAIGSCTNSSYLDLLKVTKILEGKQVHPQVSLVISPGSRQVLTMLSDSGALSILLRAGARILECACGPCIGMGQSPKSKGISLRTFNRNFEGRSGTPNAAIYLVSPEVAAVSAITGRLTDPRTYGEGPKVKIEGNFITNDNLLVFPPECGTTVEILRGPNIKPCPLAKPPMEEMAGKVLIKVGENITTDHIMPSHASLLPYRSNIPHLAKYCFSGVDSSFPERAIAEEGGIIIAGSNYGQGSSREHAALAPLYLGIKAVIAQSFARIHRANLINFGILPLLFADTTTYDQMNLDEIVIIGQLRQQLQTGNSIIAKNKTSGHKIELKFEATDRERAIILAGGLLNYTKEFGGQNNA